jgi:antitoxin VapB
MAQPAKVKVFMTGRSQAVRIPAEYRFATNEVYIRRDPQSGRSDSVEGSGRMG